MESGSNIGIIYGLEFQCRSLCAVSADTDSVSFLVGTQGLKMTNQVHHVQLNEETRMLSKKVYGHTSGEVWEISSSHGDPKLFSTRHSQVDGTTSGSLKIGGSVWKIPEDNTGPDRYMSSGEELDLVCHLRSEQSDEVDHISWLPSADDASSSKVMVLANNRLALHDISVINGVDDARLAH